MSHTQIDRLMYYNVLLFALASNISTAATSIATGIGIMLAIIKYVREPFCLDFDKSLLRGFGFFITAITISALFSYDLFLSLDRVATTALRLLTILIVIVSIKNREQMIKVLLLLAVSIFIDDLFGIWQKLQGMGRAVGFNNTPTFMGSHLIQMISVLMIVTLEGQSLPKNYRIWFGLITIVSTIALVLTQTRGVWLAFVAVITGYALIRGKHQSQVKIYSLLALVLMIGIVVIFSIPTLQDRALSITDVNHPSNFERILMWKSAWNMFIDHPLTGVGFHGFQYFYNTYYISPLAMEVGHTSPHNNFMLYLAETGIIGLSAFIYMFYSITRYFFIQYRSDSKLILSLALILATIGLLFEGLTDHNFGQASIIRLYWFLLGLAYIESKSTALRVIK